MLLSLKVFTIRSDRWPGSISPNFPCLRQGFDPPLSRRTVAPSSGFPQPIRPSSSADEWSRAASAHPLFRFLVSQAGAALHLDSGSFTGVTRQLMSLSIHRGGCPGRYPRPWATTTALSPYRTPECSRRSRSYTDRRGDGVLRSPFVSLSGSGPRPLGRGLEVLSAFGASCAAGGRLPTLGCIKRRRSGPAAWPRAARGPPADERARCSG